MKAKIFFITVITILLQYNMQGQINLGGQPYSFTHQINTTEIPKIVMAKVDNKELLQKYENSPTDESSSRFGYEHETNINLDNSGHWIDLDDGGRLWQLKIVCLGAFSINLSYNDFWLPEGGQLYLYSPDKEHILGAFSEYNNKSTRDHTRGFATAFIPGEETVLEYYEPANTVQSAKIAISKVIHAYKVVGPLQHLFDKTVTDECLVDINCDAGDLWQDEKRGIGLIYKDGQAHCTGTLVNNTAGDCNPLFLSAQHCLLINVETGQSIEPGEVLDDWIFQWNYENSQCGGSSPSTGVYTNGATLVASNVLSDFALYELHEDPRTSGIAVYYNGWSRTTDDAPQGGACIHHPGDISDATVALPKKIAIHDKVPLSDTDCNPVGLAQNFWEVTWDTAEGPNGSVVSIVRNNSSGAPLFTNNGHVIGQLLGSGNCFPITDCADTEEQVVIYGKLGVSWGNSNLTTERLKDWLDPLGTNPNSINGSYPSCTPFHLLVGPINSDANYVASGFIRALNGEVINNATVNFQAEDHILLQSDYLIEAETMFRAFIDDCECTTSNLTGGADEKDNHTSSVISDRIELAISPNPIASSAEIRFDLFQNTNQLSLEVYDITGKKVNTLLEGNNFEKGTYRYSFDFDAYSSGIFLIRLITEHSEIITQKIIIE